MCLLFIKKVNSQPPVGIKRLSYGTDRCIIQEDYIEAQWLKLGLYGIRLVEVPKQLMLHLILMDTDLACLVQSVGIRLKSIPFELMSFALKLRYVMLCYATTVGKTCNARSENFATSSSHIIRKIALAVSITYIEPDPARTCLGLQLMTGY